MDLITKGDIASMFGVSRQAVDQAFARALNAPQVISKLPNGMELFDEEEARTWWQKRLDERWRERRMRSDGPTKQVNCKITESQLAKLDSSRESGQTISGLATILLRKAINEL